MAVILLYSYVVHIWQSCGGKIAKFRLIMENVAWQVQRMQLGASQVPTRRAISHNQYVAHFQSNIRRMLLPSLHNNGIQTYISETPSGNVVPIFQVAYANQPSTTHSMAAVDENGCISIINTSPLSSSSPPTAIARRYFHSIPTSTPIDHHHAFHRKSRSKVDST